MAVVFFMTAIGSALSSYGQQNSGNTLGSLWPRIENNYPGIHAKSAAVDAAKTHARAVKTNRLPQVKVQAQNTYGTFEGAAGAFFPQAGFFNVSGSTAATTGSSVAANTFGSATAEWEIFTFGRRQKEYELAQAVADKHINEQAVYLLDLKRSLAERYITLLYNQAKLNWNNKNLQRLHDIHRITSSLSKAGLRPAADSLLALSSYNQSLADNDHFTGLKDAAMIKITELYGSPDLDYTASLIRFSKPTSDAYASTKSITVSHPALAVLQKQMDYYQLSSTVQKRASLPSVRLLGGYAVRGTGIHPNGHVSDRWKAGFSNTTGNYLFGIGAVWNITTLKTNSLKSRAFQKDAQSIQQQFSAYEITMHADLQAASTKIAQQFQQISKTLTAMKQAEKAYEMYLARYKSGLIALSELLQIRQLLENAENNHLEAAKQYWLLIAYEAVLTTDFNFLFNNL